MRANWRDFPQPYPRPDDTTGLNSRMQLITLAHTVRAYSRYAQARLASLFGAKPYRAERAGKRLVMIVWAFPPVVTGGVYRPLSFAREAALNGWDVTVVCGPVNDANEAGAYLLGQLPDSVKVSRIEHTDLKPSFRFFPRIDGGLLNALKLFEAARSATTPESVILASGPPFCTFVAGWFTSKVTGARLVLDYRDEWSLCPFDFVTANENDKVWEARCIAQASLILVTTQSFLTHLGRHFPQTSEKAVEVVPNGWNRHDFEVVSTQEVGGDLSSTICYLGYLAGHIAPDEFIATLTRAIAARPDLRSRFTLRFVGKRDPKVQQAFLDSAIGDCVEFIDQVSKTEAIGMMRQCAAVILFNPPELDRYIPGKLFDYIASGANVLSYGGAGEISKALADSGKGTSVRSGDAAGLAESIDALISGRHKPDPGSSDAWLARHERSAVAQHMLTLLDDTRN